MIKYINDGEIGQLKEGFYHTLALKKINMLNSMKFMDKELDLNNAIKIYKSIATLKFPEIYANYSSIMLEYLLKYNLLDNDEFNEIRKIFRADSEDDGIETDESICYGDYSEGRSDFILEFIRNIGYQKGIRIHSETFRDIVLSDGEDIDLNIYGDLRTTLKEHMGNATDINNLLEEDWEDEYYNIFQDDATSYVIEGYEMNDYELMLLSNTFTSSDNGVLSEVYIKAGNTFITISDMQVFDGLGYNFLIILKLIFMNKN